MQHTCIRVTTASDILNVSAIPDLLPFGSAPIMSLGQKVAWQRRLLCHEAVKDCTDVRQNAFLDWAFIAQMLLKQCCPTQQLVHLQRH